MTQEKFIEKWGNPLFNKESPGQSFASDLDELLKERAETAFKAGDEFTNHCEHLGAAGNTEIAFNNWYDTFIKEQP